jgi:hypothetical protein
MADITEDAPVETPAPKGKPEPVAEQMSDNGYSYTTGAFTG